MFCPYDTERNGYNMNIEEIILNRRSVRKFKPQEIEYGILENAVRLASYAPTAANLQYIKYKIVSDKETCASVFDNVKWAGYLPDYNPSNDEQPAAYICILTDKNIREKADVDLGAAAQNIMLYAESLDIGTCWLGAINREKIKELLKIPDKLDLNSVIALGYKAEHPKTIPLTDSVKYFLDENGTLTVPKRTLSEILI